MSCQYKRVQLELDYMRDSTNLPREPRSAFFVGILRVAAMAVRVVHGSARCPRQCMLYALRRRIYVYNVL
jgi:hypothetical protein